MPKVTANSYPLDSIKANIAVLETTQNTSEDMFQTYYECCIVPTLKELGEEASNKSSNYCLADLKKILDKHDNSSSLELNFINNEET